MGMVTNRTGPPQSVPAFDLGAAILPFKGVPPRSGGHRRAERRAKRDRGPAPARTNTTAKAPASREARSRAGGASRVSAIACPHRPGLNTPRKAAPLRTELPRLGGVTLLFDAFLR